MKWWINEIFKNSIIMKIENLKNKKIAILWFWLEWKSTLAFLEKIGISDISILDKKWVEGDYKYDIIYWDKYLDNLGDFDIIFKTPGISPYHTKIINHREKLISNAEIFFEEYKWKIIWITATKWKSTTSTLIYLTLKEAGYKVKLVWNIWNPIFEEVDILNWEEYDYIVYEFSSYMLETLEPKLFIWVLGNIYPCHIDWHNNSLEVYTQAKLNLLKNAENIVINKNFSHLLKWAEKTFWEEWNYSFDDNNYYINWINIIENSNILLAWEHNKYNISSVIWVMDIIWDKNLFKALKNVLSSFTWLSHRQEKVWVYKWITFIDDGISTTPESTIEAIKTFWENIWTIFLWWSDYWFTDESFANLRSYIEKYKIANIVLFIDTWSRVFWDISKQLPLWIETKVDLISEYSPNILKSDSMEQAVKFAYKNTKDWKICILSSASPSFSLWKSYIEKAYEFKKFMKKYW